MSDSTVNESDFFEYSTDSEVNISEDEEKTLKKIPDVSLYLIQSKDKLIGVFLTTDKKKVVGYINKNKEISSNATELSKFIGKNHKDVIINDAYDFTASKACPDESPIKSKLDEYNNKMNSWFNETKTKINKLKDDLKKDKGNEELSNKLKELQEKYNQEIDQHKKLLEQLDEMKKMKEEKDDELKRMKEEKDDEIRKVKQERIKKPLIETPLFHRSHIVSLVMKNNQGKLKIDLKTGCLFYC